MIKTLAEIPVEKLHLMTEKQKGIIENLLRENFYPSDISIDPLKIVLVYNYTTIADDSWIEFIISVSGVIEFRFAHTNWGVLLKRSTIEDLIYSMMRDEYDFNFVSEWCSRRRITMVTTRNFNASTKRQNRAVDAILTLGFFPSEIEIKSYEIWMQYNYKDTQHDDFRIVVVVYPSGQYKLIDYNEVCGVYTLEQVVEYFQKKIVYGNWFEFNYQDNFTEEQIKNVNYLISQDIKPTTMIRFGDNAHLYYNFHWYDDKALQSWTKYHVTILPDGNMEYYYPERWFTNNVVEIVYDAIVAVHKMYPHKTFENKEEENKSMKNVMTMSDAVAMALSEDYKERFIAEYVETKIRYERLHNTIIKWCAGKADFVTDIELLEEQAKHMGNYLRVLEIRAIKEDIELPNVDWRK